ncbi:MAG TPA: ADOP family duplicated permease [Gemmatimonadaceae bacterium]|jgi:predicted permease
MSMQRDIDAEVRFHLDARTDELIAQGLSPHDARGRALAEFGDVDETRTSLSVIGRRVAKGRSRLDVIDALRQDVRYVVRSLRRAPVLSLTIVLTLALGIGVNAAMFSLLDVIYLRPPTAVVHPEQLRRVWREIQAGTQRRFETVVDYRGFAAIRSAAGIQAHAIYYALPTRMKTTRAQNAPTVGVVGAPSDYFNLLGLKPIIGRFYSADEDALATPSDVAVISYDYWHRAFDGDASVLGKKLLLGVDQFTIIGVGPRGFRGLDLNAADVWAPQPTLIRHRRVTKLPWWQDPNTNGLVAVMRLAPGVNEAGLESRLTVAVRGPNIGYYQDTLSVARLGSISEARGFGKVSTETLVVTRIAAVSVLVLLIACANVVNLLLARAMNRQRELAVRLALGISRGRLIRLLMTESLLLALIASAAAVVAANWAAVGLRTLLMPGIEWAEPALHWRVLAFALAVSLVVGLTAGLAPALQGSRTDLNEALKSVRGAGRPRQRLRSALVIAQAALSLVLLVGAVLFIRSLENVQRHDVGYSIDRLVFADLSFETYDVARDAALAPRLRALEPRIAAIPGVERVAFASIRPRNGFGITKFYPDADTIAHPKPEGFFTVVTPSYFATSGMRLIVGRAFDTGTGSGSTVVVNDAFADALWPRQSALGHCLRIDATGACLQIVGVVQTAINMSVTEKPSGRIYFSLDNPPRRAWSAHSIIVRADPRRLAGVEHALRDILRAEFVGLSVDMKRMSDVMQPEYRPWILGAQLFTLLGVLALIVASVGIYSTVAYGVSQRTHEFGVRIALGAARVDVLRLVVGEGVRTVLVGIAIGILLAIGAGRFIATLLYDVTPSDPVSIMSVAAALALVAFVAAIVPARRAANADPMTALRTE